MIEGGILTIWLAVYVAITLLFVVAVTIAAIIERLKGRP